MPANSIDPILCSSSLIQNLQSIVSRNVNPKETLVVTVASINSGEANNVIPDEAELTGTIRYYDKAVGTYAREIQ